MPTHLYDSSTSRIQYPSLHHHLFQQYSSPLLFSALLPFVDQFKILKLLTQLIMIFIIVWWEGGRERRGGSGEVVELYSEARTAELPVCRIYQAPSDPCQGLGIMSSRVCVTGHIKEHLSLVVRVGARGWVSFCSHYRDHRLDMTWDVTEVLSKGTNNTYNRSVYTLGLPSESESANKIVQ